MTKRRGCLFVAPSNATTDRFDIQVISPCAPLVKNGILPNRLAVLSPVCGMNVG